MRYSADFRTIIFIIFHSIIISIIIPTYKHYHLCSRSIPRCICHCERYRIYSWCIIYMTWIYFCSCSTIREVPAIVHRSYIPRYIRRKIYTRSYYTSEWSRRNIDSEWWRRSRTCYSKCTFRTTDSYSCHRIYCIDYSNPTTTFLHFSYIEWSPISCEDSSWCRMCKCPSIVPYTTWCHCYERSCISLRKSRDIYDRS